MQTSIRSMGLLVGESTLIKSATLVAAQGAWRWQQRLRRVEYVPTRLRDGRIVWGLPVTTDSKISGGNLRSRTRNVGERSPLWTSLSDREAVLVGLYQLKIFSNDGPSAPF